MKITIDLNNVTAPDGGDGTEFKLQSEPGRGDSDIIRIATGLIVLVAEAALHMATGDNLAGGTEKILRVVGLGLTAAQATMQTEVSDEELEETIRGFTMVVLGKDKYERVLTQNVLLNPTSNINIIIKTLLTMELLDDDCMKIRSLAIVLAALSNLIGKTLSNVPDFAKDNASDNDVPEVFKNFINKMEDHND